MVFGTVNLEFGMVFIGFWYSVFDIWDSVFGTWDCAHLVFGILNEGEKKQNGRVALFALSLLMNLVFGQFILNLIIIWDRVFCI